MGGSGSYLMPLHRRGSGFVLRVDYARWGQTPEDLRHLALSAPHARTRERALARFDITQPRCATQVAMRTGRRAHTVLGWVPASNQGGPAAGPAGGGAAPRGGGGGPPPLPRAAPPRLRSAAPADAVPFLPAPRSRTRRGGLRGPAHGGHPPPRRGGSSPALDVAPPGRLGPRALRARVLSRDDPRGPAPPQAVEGPEVAGPGRSGAATSVHRAAPRWSGRRPTRSASRGLPG